MFQRVCAAIASIALRVGRLGCAPGMRQASRRRCWRGAALRGEQDPPRARRRAIGHEYPSISTRSPLAPLARPRPFGALTTPCHVELLGN
jgi:hypothetical protein